MYTQPYVQSYAQSQPQLQPASIVPVAQPQQAPMAHPQSSLFQDGSAPVFRACASAMQRPTLTNVRIRSTRDANQIFYAVLRNLLPMTVRRLDAEERRAITSGNVYVWEERGASSEATGLGIERWTDGMRWSPSRVRDEFLFYHQKELDPEEAADLPPTRWARIVRPKTTGSDGSSSDVSPDKIPHQRVPNDPEKLIKQTYSVLVALPEDRQRNVLRKWHLTAYFTQATVDKLSTVDEVLPKPHVMVPEGLFRSARAGKIRRDTGAARQQQQQQQQQQRQIAYYVPEVPGPSSTVPSSAYPPSASSSTFSPHAAPSPYTSPHAYPYSRAHVQYSAYIQDDVDGHHLPSALPPPPPPPPGSQYTIAPTLAPPPPPPPQGQSSISVQPRGLGITYARPPRDWDRSEHERNGESIQQLHREREQVQVSPQRIPGALPYTYDPMRGCVAVAAGPLQTCSPSYSPSYSHPYVTTLQRTSDAGPSGSGSNAAAAAAAAAAAGVAGRPPVSEYYSPAKPIEPIDVSSPGQTQPVASQPVSREKVAVDYHPGAEATEMQIETQIDEQRQSAIGPARVLSSISPRHNSLHLPSARLNTSPRLIPCSVLEPGSRMRSASESGPSSAFAGVVDQAALRSSPVSSKLNLEEERARLLVPLDSLENAVFPRRDPTDDALLRRFNALRTTPPATSMRDE